MPRGTFYKEKLSHSGKEEKYALIYLEIMMKKKFLREYFCALCRSPRKQSVQRHLTAFNYGQIIFLSFLFSASSFKWIGFKGIAFLPIVWIKRTSDLLENK